MQVLDSLCRTHFGCGCDLFQSLCMQSGSSLCCPTGTQAHQASTGGGMGSGTGGGLTGGNTSNTGSGYGSGSGTGHTGSGYNDSTTGIVPGHTR